MWKNVILGICFISLAGVVAWQGKAIRELRAASGETAQQATAREPSATSGANASKVTSIAASAAERRTGVSDSRDAALEPRVMELEQQVALLSKNADYLMSRGQLPLSAQKIAEIERRFMDASLTPRDRLQALGLLRRNGALSDMVVQNALSWLATATNGGLRENIVEQLGGATNAVLRDPLIKLATTDPNSNVREEAVQNLRRFVGDPQVESMLWQLLKTEEDRGVREQVAEALREAPMTPARLADMRARAIDANAPLEERLVAVESLREAGASSDDIAAALAQFVQATQNPDERARVFDAFDGASDPQMKLPLVYGLQDPNANVRARAADALSGYSSDPAVVEWLRYVEQNDTDFRVRREAEQALREARNRVQGEQRQDQRLRDGGGRR